MLPMRFAEYGCRINTSGQPVLPPQRKASASHGCDAEPASRSARKAARAGKPLREKLFTRVGR
jgi:hypothetical protein